MKPPPDKKQLFVFAGPNGAGKSTIIKHFFDNHLCPRLYICPDSLLYDDSTGFPIPSESLKTYFEDFKLYIKNSSEFINLDHYEIVPTLDAYITAMNKAEQLRDYALDIGESFTMETVLSTGKKLDFIVRAGSLGYEITVIYVVTTDPEINVRRIAQRVAMGGHDVPKEKIISRYKKCLDLMPLVLMEADMAFVYDNSADTVNTHSAFPVLHKEHDDYCLLGKGKRNERWVKKNIGKPLKKLGLQVYDLSAEEERGRFTR